MSLRPYITTPFRSSTAHSLGLTERIHAKVRQLSDQLASGFHTLPFQPNAFRRQHAMPFHPVVSDCTAQAVPKVSPLETQRDVRAINLWLASRITRRLPSALHSRL